MPKYSFFNINLFKELRIFRIMVNLPFYEMDTSVRRLVRKPRSVNVKRGDLVLLVSQLEGGPQLNFEMGVFRRRVMGGEKKNNLIMECKEDMIGLSKPLRIGGKTYIGWGPVGDIYNISAANIKGFYIGPHQIAKALRTQGSKQGLAYHADWIEKLKKPYHMKVE